MSQHIYIREGGGMKGGGEGEGAKDFLVWAEKKLIWVFFYILQHCETVQCTLYSRLAHFCTKYHGQTGTARILILCPHRFSKHFDFHL